MYILTELLSTGGRAIEPEGRTPIRKLNRILNSRELV